MKTGIGNRELVIGNSAALALFSDVFSAAGRIHRTLPLFDSRFPIPDSRP